MHTNIPLAADPYAGVRAAFFALLSHETDDGWESWLAKRTSAEGGLDDFECLADLCGEAIEQCAAIPAETASLIAYARGYFQALQSVIASIVDLMPTSSLVPNHLKRYQLNLKRFPERYIDEA